MPTVGLSGLVLNQAQIHGMLYLSCFPDAILIWSVVMNVSTIQYWMVLEISECAEPHTFLFYEMIGILLQQFVFVIFCCSA